MTLITAIILFLGALLLAIGHNSPAGICTRVGSILLAVGFGIALFGSVG
jgi:hypothetical protein